jgi:hypothetical protein
MVIIKNLAHEAAGRRIVWQEAIYDPSKSPSDFAKPPTEGIDS